jgi:hypothetical protein
MTPRPLLALLVVAALAASAQGARADGAARAADARTGPYLGVQPGLKDVAPGKENVKARGAVRVLTWVGFQMHGPGGRVFIQTSEPAVYSIVASDPNEVVLEFPDTRVQSSNDARALDTSWFPTAVASVEAQSVKGLARVVVRLREVVGYDLRQEGNYLYLDFRPPTSPGSVTPTPPASTTSP